MEVYSKHSRTYAEGVCCMKVVIWTDKKGIKHRSFLQKDMSEKRPQLGYVSDPPNVLGLDWNKIAKDLHNQLVDRGLFALEDITGNELTGAILGAIRKRVKGLYRRKNV